LNCLTIVVMPAPALDEVFHFFPCSNCYFPVWNYFIGTE